jgi:alpha-glucosidase
MQWTSDVNAGFSSSAKPWMRPHDNYAEINVKNQEKDQSSVLSFWKQMNMLRKQYADLMVFGEFEMLDEPNQGVFTFTKKRHGQTLFVTLNFSDKPQKVDSEVKGDWKLLASNVEEPREELQAFEGRVYLI